MSQSSRYLLGLALLVLSLGASARPEIELPDSARQGELVTGRVPPGSEVTIVQRTVRVSDEGWFVFGIGRDAESPQAVRVRLPDGTTQTVDVTVQKRDYRIERVDGLPPSTVTPNPELEARIAREQARANAARERDDDRVDFLQRLIWPVEGRVSGVYGSQRVLNGEPRNPHYGLDVAVPTGTPLKAPAGGVITLAEKDFFLTGGTLIVDHGHGVSSVFIHLSRLDKAVGDRVEQGDVIGAVGATGRATGPHMHWGMNWFDVRLDPQLLLPAR